MPKITIFRFLKSINVDYYFEEDRSLLEDEDL